MIANRNLMAPAPQFNASGTLGPGHAIEDVQSNGGDPLGNSQENDQSDSQGNAMQYQWSYGDNDQLNCENSEPLNTQFESFYDKNGKPSEDVAEATKPGNPKNSGPGDSEEQREHGNQERHQGLHPNVTVRNTQVHSLQTPRHLIKGASREATTIDRNDDDRCTAATYRHHTAGNGSRGDFEAPQEIDQYDPTGHPYQPQNSSLRQNDDSDLHAAWGNSRPHGRQETGIHTKRVALTEQEQSRREELADQLLLDQASHANGYWHDNIWFNGVLPPHGGTHREQELQLGNEIPQQQSAYMQDMQMQAAGNTDAGWVNTEHGQRRVVSRWP